MMRIAVDIGKSNCQVCVADDEFKIVEERRVKTERTILIAFFQRFTDVGAEVLLESGTSTEWIALLLEELRLTVIVADPASIPLRTLGNRNSKTDKRDARGLLEALRLKAFRPAHRRRRESRDDVALIQSRKALVGQRTALINQVRAMLELDGHRPARCASTSMPDAVDNLELPDEYLARRGLDVLVEMIRVLSQKIGALDKRVELRASHSPHAQRLMDVPGVGPITALMFSAHIDDPHRFRSAKQVRAYLGLVPREYSSGERRQLGKISKAGDPTMRALLVQASLAFKNARDPRCEELRRWAAEVSVRRGKGRATVALARRLSGILWALMRDAQPFRPPTPVQAAA